MKFGELYEKKLSESGKKGLEELNTLVSSFSTKLKKDDMLGLVKRCLKMFVRHKIASQTRTYVTLSLQDLAKTAGCHSKEEAESVLVDMISQGEISAQVDQATEVVLFLDEEISESGGGSSGGLLEMIANQTTKMLLIAKSLRDKNESLTTNKTYVSKFVPQKNSGSNKRRDMGETSKHD